MHAFAQIVLSCMILQPIWESTILPVIDINRNDIARFCRKHHMRRLALYDSVLRDDFGPGSDVDVLVEFERGKTPGLAFFGMQNELSLISTGVAGITHAQFFG